MTPDKQRQKLAGQSAIARKVFECVPIAEGWTHHQIMEEMRRVTGGGCHEVRTVLGCLNAMVDAGLARRHQGKYCREPVSAAAPSKKTQEAQAMTTDKKQTPAAPVAHSALDLIGGLAHELRGFADRLDAIAVQVVELHQDDAALADKYRAVQQLLSPQ